MINKYFDIKESVYDITEKYSEAIDLLVSLGFSNLKDENMRKTFGKSISLENALKLKRIDVDSFIEQFLERIKDNENITKGDKKETIVVKGVLPCPVKVPLAEAFEKFISESNFDFNIDHELKAASMGIDWIKEGMENKSIEEMPDLFISAGFELFFDKNLLGKFKSDNMFEDITGIENYNKDLNNDYMSLQDPNKQYSMIAVVPAVFLVNKDELNGRKMPESWADLLDEEFENSVSLPVSDFDLFNSILLSIYNKYGEEGIKKLGRSFLKNLHPSEMVKSHIKKYNKPVVSIMPYFFTWMAKEGSPMVMVWPKDGAIISPIFMLSKKDKKEKLKPIVDFFASKEIGEILSHQGKFPSVNPNVDNLIPEGNKFMWLGWDFIQKHDVSLMIKDCEDIFNKAVKGE